MIPETRPPSGRSRHGNRDFWIAPLAIGGAILMLLRASAVQASCAPQAPKIVWSYPADGEANVPTNARLLYLTSLSGQRVSRIELNGKPLPEAQPPEGPPYGRALGLEPRTTYTVALTLEGFEGSAATTLSWRFNTGAGPAPSGLPPALAITRVTALPERDLSPVCAQAWRAMDCFDTGQNTHIVFETDVRPVLFFVAPEGAGSSVPWPMAWPGTCGSPEIYVRGATGCRGPHRVHAVAHNGEAVSAQVDCNAQPAGPARDAGPVTDGGPTPARPPGCAVGGGSGASPIAALLLLAGLAGIALRRGRSPKN